MEKIQKNQQAILKLMKSKELKLPVRVPVLKGSIPADPNRSLIKADFNDEGALVLSFDDGKTLKTRPVAFNLEQYVSVNSETGGSGPTPPQDIAVRFVSSDTTVSDSDDILIVTATATVLLPSSSEKTFRIKRSGPGDVTILAAPGDTIEFQSDLVLNINLYSVDLHFDGVNNWVVL